MGVLVIKEPRNTDLKKWYPKKHIILLEKGFIMFFLESILTLQNY